MTALIGSAQGYKAMAANVLVLGGSGCLGRALIRALSGRYKTFNWDYSENSDAAVNLLVKDLSPVLKLQSAEENFKGTKFAGIYCVAGGWERCSIDSHTLNDSLARMYAQNCEPSLLAAQFAQRYLAEGGHLVLTGSQAAHAGPLPDQLTYDLAKNFVHTLGLNLGLDESFAQRHLKTYTLLPTVLDTPANHETMPKAAKEGWIPPAVIAAQLRQWLESGEGPASGSFVSLGYKRGCLEVNIK